MKFDPYLDCMMTFRLTFTLPVDSVLKPNLLKCVPLKQSLKVYGFVLLVNRQNSTTMD